MLPSHRQHVDLETGLATVALEPSAAGGDAAAPLVALVQELGFEAAPAPAA